MQTTRRTGGSANTIATRYMHNTQFHCPRKKKKPAALIMKAMLGEFTPDLPIAKLAPGFRPTINGFLTPDDFFHGDYLHAFSDLSLRVPRAQPSSQAPAAID